MRDLRVSLIQCDILWQQPDTNRTLLTEKFRSLEGNTDLIILPEMFTTGFSMDTSMAETMDGPTVAWMTEMSEKTGAAITGSIMFKDEGGLFKNRLIWATPGGKLRHYDKRHLFTFAREHEAYAKGRDRLIVEWQGWRICPLICYDLRFPVWSRNVNFNSSTNPDRVETSAYDLLIYVANWPEVRTQAWKDLLVARAHENLAYVAGVNRVGTDGLGHAYSGDSRLFGPRGESLAAFEPHLEGTVTATLDAEALMAHRQRFPALGDADSFTFHF